MTGSKYRVRLWFYRAWAGSIYKKKKKKKKGTKMKYIKLAETLAAEEMTGGQW